MAKKKMDKKGKGGKTGVKGERESYSKSAAKENKMPKGKGKETSQPHHRLSAYEEYAARYKKEEKKPNPPADIHHRHNKADSPSSSQKGGIMEVEEFNRLKRAQQKEKLKMLK